jgi:hypothetical protein
MGLTIEKERNEKTKDQQARKRHEEKTNVTQITSDRSSACGNRPSCTSCIPKGQRVHADARCLGKYLLGLELTDAGFDASVLSEFRARLIDRHAQERGHGENAHAFSAKRLA